MGTVADAMDFHGINRREGGILMRFGICTTPENIGIVEQAGFDYVELTLNAVAALPEDEFQSLLRKVDASSIKVEACNGFFPWSMRVVGPNANLDAIRSYVRVALSRVAKLGGKAMVVGNGGSRRMPDGYAREAVVAQFSEVLSIIGAEAAKYGIVGAVEPLNVRETDFINSIAEGAAIVRAVNHPNIKLLADFYHMRMDDEPMTALLEAQGLLRHVHIANCHDRVFPADTQEDIYAEFFEMLRRIGYDERVSIEGNVKNLAKEAPLALAVLKKVHAGAKG
jgi:sugar phosphate isomerase/epimerase